MIFSRVSLLFFVFVLPVTNGIGQNAPAASPAPVAAPASTSYTDALEPAVNGLREALSGLTFDRWKGGNVRGEAQRNAGSIMTDIDQTLPDLVKAADAEPGRVAAALPLSRNFAALYDVALRVLDGARIAAPAEQADRMQQAVNGMVSANAAMYARMQQAAAAQETHVTELETKVKAQAAVVPPVQTPPPACPAPPVKHAVKRKPKPATTQPATQGNGTASKPSN